jgi:hypothetical protein
MLRALRNANSFLQNQRELTAGWWKILEAHRPLAQWFYAFSREQFNPDLTVTDSVIDDWILVGVFRAKKNHRQAATGRR